MSNKRKLEWSETTEICPGCGGLIEELHDGLWFWALRCRRCKTELSYLKGRGQAVIYGRTEAQLLESGTFLLPKSGVI